MPNYGNSSIKSQICFLFQVDAFAAGLLALGLQKGDRIGIWGHNHLEWVITMYAAVKAGLILVSSNILFDG